MSSQEEEYPRYRFVVAVLVALLAFHNGLTAAIPALFMQEMAADWGVPIGAMGLYMGLIGVVPIIFFAWSAPLGYKIGFKRCAVIYLILKLGTLAGVAFTPNYFVALSLKLVEGAAAIFLSISVLPIIRTWFSRKAYGKLSSWTFGIPTSFGVMTFFFITPILFSENWRNAHFLYGTIAGVLLVVWVILGKGPLVEPSQKARAKAENYFEALKTNLPQVIRIREILLLSVWMFLGTGLGRAMTSWFPSYLQLEWGWSEFMAALLMNVQNGVNILSSPVAGAVSDKIGYRRPFIIIAGAMNCLAIFMSVNFVGPALWFWYGAFGLYTSLDGFTLNTILMEHPKIGYRLFPYAMSVVTLFGTIGIFVMPTILGIMLDASGSLYWGLILVALLNLIVFAIGLFMRETGWKAETPVTIEPKMSPEVKK